MNLSNHFLLATPALRDSIFSKSLIWIGAHDEDGALGFVVNKPSKISAKKLLTKLCGGHPPARRFGADEMVVKGGPLRQEQIFVLHTPHKTRYDKTSGGGEDGIATTVSRDIVDDILKTGGPEKIVLVAGHAGWGGGQLEDEVAQNAWVTLPADAAIIFGHPPEERLAAAVGKLGFNWQNFAHQTGRA